MVKPIVCVIMLAVSSLCSAAAGTVTWIGVSGGNWSEGTNWVDGDGVNRVPTGSDDVFVNVGSVVITGNAPINSLTVNGATELTLSGSGTLELAAADTKFGVYNGGALNIDVPVIGSGRLYRVANKLNGGVQGPIRLRAHNAFTGGVAVNGLGDSWAENIIATYADSLGGPDANGVYGTVTMAAYTRVDLLEAGTTYPQNFESTGAQPRLFLPKNVGTLHFSGKFLINGGLYLKQTTDGVINFDAPVEGYGTNGSDFDIQLEGTPARVQVHFNKGLNLVGHEHYLDEAPPNRRLYRPISCGVYLYGGEGITNSWSEYNMCGGATVFCMAENVLARNPGAKLVTSNWNILDLNGYGQETPRLTSQVYGSSAGGWTIQNTAATSVALTVTRGAAGDTTETGIFAGNLSLVYSPVVESATLTVNGGNHTLTGPIVAAGGTLTLNGGSVGAVYANLQQLQVREGATLVLNNLTLSALDGLTVGANASAEISGAMTIPEDIELLTGAGSTLTLGAGVVIKTTKATIRGVKLVAGRTYSGASGIAGLAGEGLLQVPGQEAPDNPQVWNAGDAASTDIASARNWASGSTPDFDDGGLIATFSKGERATLSKDVRMRGVVFASEDGDFTVDGSGMLSLGKAGVSAPAGRATLEVPVALDADQTWNIADVTARVALKDGLQDGDLPSTLTKTGYGMLEIDGTSNFSGTLSYDQGLIQLSGEDVLGPNAHLYAQPLREKLNGAFVRAGLVLSNAVVRSDLKIETRGQYTVEPDYGDIRAVYGDNEFGGFVSCRNGMTGQDYLCLFAAADSSLELSGGVDAHNVFFGGDGTFNVTKAIAPPSGKAFLNMYFGANNKTAVPKVHFYETAGPAYLEGRKGEIHCHVPNVFGTADSTRITGCDANGTLKICLHGNDQYFKWFPKVDKNGDRLIFESEEPATVSIAAINQYSPNSSFQMIGNVSILRTGTSACGEHALYQDTSATGSVACTAATLTFAETAVFRCTTNLTVGADSTIRVTAPGNLPKLSRGLKRHVSVAATGALELGEGVRLDAATADFADAPLKNGLYGSVECAVPGVTVLPQLSGRGVLRVGAWSGLMLILR